MSYVILNTDGSVFATLADQEINTTDCSLSLLGRGAANYGQAVATNFVQLLENFSAASAPPNPIEGQIWWDKTSQNMMVYNSAGAWIGLGFGGQTSGTDGAISLVTISVEGSGVGFQNINPAAPANDKRYRTSVLANGDWVLQAINDDGTVRSTPLTIDPNNVLTTIATINGEAATAGKLATAITLSLSGDASGSVLFDGSADTTLDVALSPSGVAVGSNGIATYSAVVVDAAGRVVSGLGSSTGGLALTGDVTGTGAGSIVTALSKTGVAVGTNGLGTYSAVVVDAKGRVQSGAGLTATGDVVGTASGGSITLALAPVAGLVPGTYGEVVVDATGRVVSGVGSGSTASLTLRSSLGPAYLDVDGSAGSVRIVRFSTATLPRFDMTLTTDAESGSNVGANLEVLRYDDSGNLLGAALTIDRATGAVSIEGDLSVGGAISGTFSGNAATASKLLAARTISITGDGYGGALFDGSSDAIIDLTLNTQSALSGGGTFSSVVVNAKGIVTGGTPVGGSALSVGSYSIFIDGNYHNIGDSVTVTSNYLPYYNSSTAGATQQSGYLTPGTYLIMGIISQYQPSQNVAQGGYIAPVDGTFLVMRTA